METFGLPLPGETILITTSAISSQGDVSIYLVVIVAILASITGDSVAFMIGRRYGRIVVLAYGNRIGITEEKYRAAERFTESYGAAVVVVARFFLLLRQLNGLVAGTAGVQWHKFLVASIIGSSLWVGFWTTTTYKMGKSASLLPWITHHVSLFVAAIVIALFSLGTALYLRAKQL